MVDISGIKAPRAVPDPAACKDFADWVTQLTAEHGRRYGVTQRLLATVAGSTPQSVTKWKDGGSIELERITRIAGWAGLPYQQLRNLVDTAIVGDMPLNSDLSGELANIWQTLNPKQRKQLLQLARRLRK